MDSMEANGRRAFIRVLGGSIVSAAVPLAGCSGDYPAEAVAAWRGPRDGDDLRRWALGHAILAPNSHNRQPWIADLREPGAIVLRVDRERLLPETDPWFRQIVVSQGTFLEALVIALRERGVVPEVTLFPEGEFAPRDLDDRPVARVTWAPAPTGTAKDPLFAQLLRRHTAKVNYDTSRPVSAETLAALRTAVVDPAVRFGATVAPSQRDALRALCLDSAVVEVRTPRTMMESMRLIRLGPDEIAKNRDGISINTPMPRLAAAVGAFDRSAPPAEGSTGYKQAMDRFEGHSRSAMGFAWLSTPVSADVGPRSREVRAGRAYMRLQLKATELGVQMHPMSQAAQEFPEMAAHHARLHALLVDRPAAAEPVQMFCRLGYAPEQQHTPRRGVDAIVRA